MPLIQRLSTRSLRILISFEDLVCVFIDSPWCHGPPLEQRIDLLDVLDRHLQIPILYHLSSSFCEEVCDSDSSS
jgi:hypothetical protein